MYLNGVRLEAGTRVKCIELRYSYYRNYYDVGDICIVKDNGQLVNPRTGHNNLGGIYAYWEVETTVNLQYEEMI